MSLEGWLRERPWLVGLQEACLSVRARCSPGLVLNVICQGCPQGEDGAQDPFWVQEGRGGLFLPALWVWLSQANPPALNVLGEWFCPGGASFSHLE